MSGAIVVLGVATTSTIHIALQLVCKQSDVAATPNDNTGSMICMVCPCGNMSNVTQLFGVWMYVNSNIVYTKLMISIVPARHNHAEHGDLQQSTLPGCRARCGTVTRQLQMPAPPGPCCSTSQPPPGASEAA